MLCVIGESFMQNKLGQIERRQQRTVRRSGLVTIVTTNLSTKNLPSGEVIKSSFDNFGGLS